MLAPALDLRSTLLPERREAGIADAVILQWKMAAINSAVEKRN
jgi:hypothetical protein